MYGKLLRLAIEKWTETERSFAKYRAGKGLKCRLEGNFLKVMHISCGTWSQEFLTGSRAVQQY